MKNTCSQKAGICKGKANHKGCHGTNLETTWIKVGHAQIVDKRIIMLLTARRTNKA